MAESQSHPRFSMAGVYQRRYYLEECLIRNYFWKLEITQPNREKRLEQNLLKRMHKDKDDQYD